MAATEFEWPVPAGHPAFVGHFPGRPIVPGVVLLDRAIILADRLLGHARPADWQIGNAKFFSPVGPGETLTYRLEIKASGAVAFNVRAGGRDVASGSLTPPRP